MKLPWLTPSEALNRPLFRQQMDDAAYKALLQAESTRRLGFHVGNIGLLIAQHETSELTEVLSICPIPNTAQWLLGIINLRGNLVPVFDLNTLLGLARETDRKSKPMLLILGQGESAGALMIDDLPIHITLTTADKLESLPPLPEALQPYATVGYEKNGEVWFNFDHFGFFESLANRIAT